jgi:hypothetical protein
LNIILVEEIGNGFIKTINVNEIKNYLRWLDEFIWYKNTYKSFWWITW